MLAHHRGFGLTLKKSQHDWDIFTSFLRRKYTLHLFFQIIGICIDQLCRVKPAYNSNYM